MDLRLDTRALVNLRHLLHANAEVANHEEATAKIIIEFLEQFEPDKIWTNVGGFGIVALFDGQNEGASVGFRADMDALHIDETIALEYASQTPNVAHKCGHDGHMTMVAGLAAYLHKHPLQFGRVYLIFQPAEETGEGAARIRESLDALEIRLDYLFGLHNLAGYPKGQILTKSGTFAAASRGMIIKLVGKTSHAAEPEYGISPVMAIAEIMMSMTKVHLTESFTDLTLATVIHSEIGEITFGTSPAYGELRITLRAMRDVDMQKLLDYAENLVKEQAEKEQLESEISYTEIFPATENTIEAFEIMKSAAERFELGFKTLEQAMKWSEDFGQYKLKMKTGFFGIGAGENSPHLHDETYDFPDDILLSGVQMYLGLIHYFKLY